MQARQHSVEQFSRGITADARCPIWQPIGRNSEAPAFVEGGLRFGFSAFRVAAGFPFCAREFRSTNFWFFEPISYLVVFILSLQTQNCVLVHKVESST
jgi:hypothetical protein